MSTLTPTSAEEMAFALAEASRGNRSTTLIGNNSKRLMGGPVRRADIIISTNRLKRVLRYEPEDLTVSVEAGMPFTELQDLLAKRGQMVALDPPFSDESTVGGVVAADTSGALRQKFGTARDLVIGMTFATLGGKLVSSGGMVVKNVAGLDIAKVMIGSFGTLAAITSVNFRLHPIPESFRTFLFSTDDLDSCLIRRDQILQSQLQPFATDILSPSAAARLNLRGHLLLVRAGGSSAVLTRYQRELAGSEVLAGELDEALWRKVRDFTADFLRRQTAGVVLRISTPLRDLGLLLREVSGSSIARAASGVTYVYLSSSQSVSLFSQLAEQHGWTCVVEYAPDEARLKGNLWLTGNSAEQQNSFGMMKSVKQMFDEHTLLNHSRLYGRI